MGYGVWSMGGGAGGRGRRSFRDDEMYSIGMINAWMYVWKHKYLPT